MIPVLDLKRQYQNIKAEIDAAISDVLSKTQFVMGPPVVELEERVASYCGCRYGVGVASGTDALRLSLAALGVGAGDEVITTPFTFVASASTISRAGARPVFVDIDPDTYNLDPAAVEAAITERTKAIVPVHLYGHPAKMDELMAIAGRANLFVVEDCAQAIGARFDDRPLGSFGHAGCLSFFPSKNLGAYGDGGMVVTSDAKLAEKIDVLRRQGGKRKYYHEELGFNSRLDTLQAAVLNVKLKYLDEWNESRRRVARRYDEMLAGLPVTAPREAPNVHHVYHQYTIRAKERAALAEHLAARQVATMIYYPVPLHRQPLYAASNSALELPHAELAAEQVLSLPMFPELTARDQQHVADSVRSFYGR